LITKYLKGVNILNKSISVTLSLSTIMLFDLQIQEMRVLSPLVNLIMHIWLKCIFYLVDAWYVIFCFITFFMCWCIWDCYI